MGSTEKMGVGTNVQARLTAPLLEEWLREHGGRDWKEFFDSGAG
jgi:hypothetical protein